MGSAKTSYLRPEGIVLETQIFSNLNQLLDVILNITGFNEYLNLNIKSKKEKCIEILSIDKFLLIVDNFETINKPSEFVDFFEEIGNLCEETKIILTTRHQIGSSEKIIDLKEFTENEYEEFFKYLYNEKFHVPEKLEKSTIKKFYSFSGGVALATEFLLGQVNSSTSLNKILHKIENKEFSRKEEVLEFSYKESFKMLDEQSKKVLYSVCLLDFPKKSNISFISSITEIEVEEIISKLKNISFINISNDTMQEETYSILPLTKIFITQQIESEKKVYDELTLKHKEYIDIINVRQSEDSYMGYNTPDSKDSTALMFAKAGYSRAEEKDFSKSQEYFDKAKEYGRTEPLVWFYLAKAENEFSNTVRNDYFETALRYSVSNDQKELILVEWGKALFNSKQHIDSVNKFLEALKIKPNNNGVYHLLGKSQYEIGKNNWQKRQTQESKRHYNASRESFLKSLYTNPKTYFEQNGNAVGYSYLAKISLFNKDLVSAEEFINQGLKLQPNNYKFREFLDSLKNRF